MNFYIKAICHSIIGIVILLLSSLIIIPSLLKLVVTKILYRLFTGHNMDCLTGIDAMCMYLGAKRNSISNKYYSHHYINLVIMVNGFIDIGKFVQRFQEKVIDAVEYPNGPKTFPRMTHLVVQKLNYFTWMPDNNFDVFNHFRINDVGYSDESSLMSVLANVFELPLPLERPPWEVVVIPKVVSPSPDDQLESCRRDNYVLVFKCHHCLVDGLAIYELAKCLVSEDTKWNSLPEPKSSNKDANLPLALRYNPCFRFFNKTAADNGKLTLKLVWDIIINALQIVVHFPMFTAQLMFNNEDNNLRGFNLSGKITLAATKPVNFSEYKNIAKDKSCSINEVFITCMAGALKTVDPSATSFRFLVPMQIYHVDTQIRQNFSTAANFKLRLKHKCKLDLIKRIAPAAIRSRLPLQAIIHYMIISMYVNCFPSWLLNFFINNTSATMVVSNVRGFQQEGLFFGNRVTDILAFPPHHGKLGMAAVFLTYNGMARIAVSVDRALQLDAESLVKAIEEEFVSLKSRCIRPNSVIDV